jgi:hypothetical protein
MLATREDIEAALHALGLPDDRPFEDKIALFIERNDSLSGSQRVSGSQYNALYPDVVRAMAQELAAIRATLQQAEAPDIADDRPPHRAPIVDLVRGALIELRQARAERQRLSEHKDTVLEALSKAGAPVADNGQFRADIASAIGRLAGERDAALENLRIARLDRDSAIEERQRTTALQEIFLRQRNIAASAVDNVLETFKSMVGKVTSPREANAMLALQDRIESAARLVRSIGTRS